MAEKYRTKGFVFKKSESAESDGLFSVFTEDFGRIEVRGRAIRKINSKLRAGIRVNCFSEIEFVQGKYNKTLTDTCLLKNRKNYFEQNAVLAKISGILDSFIKGQEKDEKLFSLLGEIDDKIGKWDAFGKIDLLYYYFAWNFLHLQGYSCLFSNCVLCGGGLIPEEVYFSAKEGGAICPNCKNKTEIFKINSDTIKILRIIVSKDWDTFIKLKFGEETSKLLDGISENAILSFCPA